MKAVDAYNLVLTNVIDALRVNIDVQPKVIQQGMAIAFSTASEDELLVLVQDMTLASWERLNLWIDGRMDFEATIRGISLEEDG